MDSVPFKEYTSLVKYVVNKMYSQCMQSLPPKKVSQTGGMVSTRGQGKRKHAASGEAQVPAQLITTTVPPDGKPVSGHHEAPVSK